MKNPIFKRFLTRMAGASVSVISLLWGQSAFGETQYNISLTMTPPPPGSSASFTASDATSSGTGTFYNTYSGIGRYSLGTTVSGRYAPFANTTRYGVDFGEFHLFQSFLTPNSLTAVSSSTTCPGTLQTYGFINVRTRSPVAVRNPQDATDVAFRAGGVFTYQQSASPDITGTNFFNLAGPTLNITPGYTADGFASATCASGRYSIQVSGNRPWDNFGSIFFGTTGGVIMGSHGTPIVSVFSPIENLTVGRMSQLAGRALSGLYQEFNSATVTTHNIYLYPDGSGTTFTLRGVSDLDDPNSYSTFGTLTCTNRNSPTTGFCSGTLSRNGVGGTGNVVCQISSRSNSDFITCAAQKPGETTIPIGIVARNYGTSLLAVALPNPMFDLPSASTTTLTATVRNLTGSPVVTMSVPAAVEDRLTSPFSLPSAFSGAGGKCAATLGGYQTCSLDVQFAPSNPGTYSQILRVAYDNQVATVNATANVIGLVSLVSITVTPSGSFTTGTTQQFTAIATYSDSSTQNITNAVTWGSSNAGRATISSTGLATFITAGSVDITANTAGVTGSRTITLTNPNSPPAGDFAISEPNGVGDSVARGEPFNIRFTGGADSDSVADVYFYAKTTNTGCNSGGIGTWGTALNNSNPAKEGIDSGMSWDTSSWVAGTYFICGRITDGVSTVYAVSTNTVTISSIAHSKFITVHPTTTSEKSYNFLMDLYENNLSAAGALDNVNPYGSNTTTRVAESEAGAFGAQGTIAWSAAYRACVNRGTGWRLPTSQEFEEAIIGVPNNGLLCNTRTNLASTAMPYNSGSCVSSQGVYDLLGNLMEWVDLTTTGTANTLGSSSIKAATDEGASWVGKAASNYNGTALQATGVILRWDPQLGLPTTSGSITSGFTASDAWTLTNGTSFVLIRGGFYNVSNINGGRYYARIDRAPQNSQNAAIGFRCAKSAYTVPSIRITAPTAANTVTADGANNATITFQGYDSDDNADISLYYRQYSSSSGCSGNPADNGWTLIDDTLKENTNTSKVFNMGVLPTGFYFVCARISDNKNSPQYYVSTGVLKKGTVTDSPRMTIVEPTGNNDTVFENVSYDVTFSAADYDTDAALTFFYKTSDSTGCSGTPTSNGWTAVTTIPSAPTDNNNPSSVTFDITSINAVQYPANLYVCGRINNGTTSAYANSGSNYLRVLPLSRCASESGNYSTAQGGCRNSVRGLVYSIDALTFPYSTATYAGAVSHCATMNTEFWGGYNDWRLATRTELGNLATDGITNLFINSSSNRQVWSSDNPGGTSAWAVNLNTGVNSSILETSAINAICVRP
jgi:hypothetical protein